MPVPDRVKLLIIIFYISLTSHSGAEIFVNHLGYRINDPKIVFVNQPADSFEIYNAINQSLVFEGCLELFSVNDPGTGMDLYTGDFTELAIPGHYYCKISNGDSSFQIVISDTVYNSLYQESFKGFYFQRCGFDLIGPTVGNYYHTRCHIYDGNFHPSTGSTGFHLSRGGWHDAGDYGKYVVNAGISVGTLLMAYEYFTSSFNQDDLNIAESGNGTPDVLDEIRHELEWLLSMQANDGAVYHKLTPEQFAPFIMPQNDNGIRYIYQTSTTATADFAAVMAKAARIYYAVDSTFSNLCLSASEQAWNYLVAHPNIIPSGGFTNPPGTATGEYGDSDDRDERLWAAVEIYLTTGSSDCHNYFLSNYNQTGLINSSMTWSNVKSMALLTYIFGNRPDINISIQNTISASLNIFCQNLVIRSFSNGFNVTLIPGEYLWGSNSIVMNNCLMLILAYEKIHNEIFQEVALNQLHYILGSNAHNLSFVTGIGAVSPMFPHHRPSGSDGIVDPVPGLLVGGPDQYLSDPILQAHFTSSTPPALCYMDDEGSYASNEIAINWNAPLTVAAGYFSGNTITNVGSGHEVFTFPGNFILQQNYPNPFNSGSKIEFILFRRTRVRLEIFDVRGGLIEVVLEKDLGIGQHSIFINADSLPSGIYWYKLSTETSSKSKKMVLIK
jgi:endoglucanase